MTQPMQRETGTYDPFADARVRFPHWRFEVKPLHGLGEQIWLDQRVYELDIEIYAIDPERIMAHALVHLDHHSDPLPEWFSERYEDEAFSIADFRLGQVDLDPS